MKFAEKYSRATGSSDLTCDQYHADTDSLAAAALSGDFGNLLFRVKFANDASSYHTLQTAWRERVATKAAYRNWPAHVKPLAVADAALEFWLTDICQPCEGRGFEKHPSAPILSDKACKSCNGTGTRILHAQSRIQRYVADMVEELQQMAIDAGDRAIKKLANEMDL